VQEIPKETETIAAKRSLRLAEKLRNAGTGIGKSDSWWNSGISEYFLVVLLFFINLYSVSSYFGTTTYEDTFYSGPIIPALAKLLELAGVPLVYGFQLVNIFFILLLPITLYMFVKLVTERKLIAYLAVLFASLPMYPFASVRIYSSLIGLDGAHISSISIAMLALMWLFKFIKQGEAKNLAFSSLFSSVVALMSPFGFSTFFIMSCILAFSEMLLGLGRVKFFRFISVMIFTASMISFWYNPHFAFWLLTGSLGEEVRRTVFNLLPISFFALPALGAFGYLLFDRRPSLQPVFLASFFSIAFCLISLVGGGVFPSHPSRYVAELGIALAMLLAVVIVKVTENLKIFENKKMYFRFGIIVLFAGLTTLIILGNGSVAYDSNVLGIWTGVEKGTIWQERDKFGGISSLLGHTITIMGIAVLLFIVAKSQKSAYEVE
jgi:hypothetical protein